MKSLLRLLFHAIVFSSLVAFPAVGAVRSITLPHFEPDMPEGPGREEFLRVCASCHSARYILMQPAFSQKQWEESVSKMVKVYGAQMNDPQKTDIVAYLTFIRGKSGSVPTTVNGAHDEEANAIRSRGQKGSRESFPLIKLSTDPAIRESDISRGAVLFGQNCAGCHGANGRGDGVIAPSLNHFPANLTAARYRDEFISEVLWNGVRGTSMPSWRGLPETNSAAILAFIKSLQSAEGNGKVSSAPTEHTRRLYESSCASCHGLSGDGLTPAAASLFPPPSNWQWKQPATSQILKVLNEGIPGAGMPSYKGQLSQSEINELALFVRSFYQE